MIIEIITTMLGASTGAILIWTFLISKLSSLKEELKTAQSSLRSAYVKFGQAMENYAPFTKLFPSNHDKFIFMGQPVDGISFDEDMIRFYEFKTGKSQLSSKQKKIKNMVEEGRVEFKELRYGD